MLEKFQKKVDKVPCMYYCTNWIIQTKENMVMAITPAAISGVISFVLAERIKEIRSGEEDDLSKY